MRTPEFRIPGRLSRALAGDSQGLSFAEAIWGLAFPALADLDDLPEGAEIVALDKEPANLEALRRADRLVAVKAYSTTSAIVQALSHLHHLRIAFLIDLKCPGAELQRLSGCASLEHLLLFSAKTLTDLGPLAGLRKLRSLFLHDVPGLDLTMLPPLPTLNEFVFYGNFLKGVKLQSFAPLGRLDSLRRLELRNVRAADGSLAPLAALRGLEHLFLPTNEYEVEEYARLASALPAAQGRCLNPLWEPGHDEAGAPRFACPKCGGPQVFLTGKETRRSCRVCNAARVDQHLARWNAAR
ncbi:MAG: hypothetical protein P4L84_04525 [Isosphaeraceae bacterium]|nr:hypothetical protein [Isosphaeraceae bacterium]